MGGNKDPFAALVASFVDDVDIVQQVKYKIDNDDYNEAMNYFIKQCEIEMYLPPNEL